MRSTRWKWRSVIAIAAISMTTLTLRPGVALAAAPHRKCVRGKSKIGAIATLSHADTTSLAILPPPHEPPPPPPPPGEGTSSDWSSGKSAGGVETSRNPPAVGREAEDGDRVLKLPQVLPAHSRMFMTAKSEDQANPFNNYDELTPCEYFDDENNQPEPPQNYNPDVQASPPNHDPSRRSAAPGGYIPVDPRGIVVTPGSASPIPPTSPLLTPPRGSAAMPNVWPR
jgi:hypothetical protein